MELEEQKQLYLEKNNWLKNWIVLIKEEKEKINKNVIDNISKSH